MDTILYHGMEGGVTNRALRNQQHTPKGGHIETIMGGGVILGCHTVTVTRKHSV